MLCCRCPLEWEGDNCERNIFGITASGERSCHSNHQIIHIDRLPQSPHMISLSLFSLYLPLPPLSISMSHSYCVFYLFFFISLSPCFSLSLSSCCLSSWGNSSSCHFPERTGLCRSQKGQEYGDGAQCQHTNSHYAQLQVRHRGTTEKTELLSASILNLEELNAFRVQFYTVLIAS